MEKWISFTVEGENDTETDQSYPYDPVLPMSSVESSPQEDSEDNLSSPEVNQEDAETPPSRTHVYRSLADIYEQTEPVEMEGELQMMTANEPMSFQQAFNEHHWKIAMQTELNSIEKNETWRLTYLLSNQKAIGLKWIFKIKGDPRGSSTLR